jgi:hypothetical protein
MNGTEVDVVPPRDELSVLGHVHEVLIDRLTHTWKRLCHC